ncbi:hypothetical protein EIP91_009335 [Steccherinum ochraceum]|uniref:Uncharacterized protein n=1 Tax=Steccherinum ochraceum TaxID=92696 RepID=A0A4R0RRP8_9APHY|nr:hypothetical protein EIP91_009335 [Steccherinum ochraceum]
MAGHPELSFHSLDTQILYYYQMIVSLKTKRNTLVPINRLPPEILAEVFRLCTRILDIFIPPSREWFDEFKNDRFIYPWIALTHVCHHWRYTALATPDLWGTIHLGATSSDVRKAFVARAKFAPLYIDVLGVDDFVRDASMLRASLPLLDRAQSIEFNLPQDYFTEVLSQFPTTLPRLRRLVLHPRLREEHNATLPIFLTRCTLPALQVLSVSEYALPWTYIPTTLTELYIQKPPATNAPCVPHFIQILGTLPSLRHLTLFEVFSGDVELLEVTKHAVLDRLETLYLVHGDAIEGIHFLGHLVIQPSAGISLKLRNVPLRSSNPIQFADFFKRLSSRIPLISSIDALELYYSDITFYPSSTPRPPRPFHDRDGPTPSYDPGPYLSLHLEPYGYRDGHDRIYIPSILDAIAHSASQPFYGIKHVSMTHTKVNCSLKSFFAHLPDLETLLFTCSDTAKDPSVGIILESVLVREEVVRLRQVKLSCLGFGKGDDWEGSLLPESVGVCCELVQLIRQLVLDGGRIEEIVVDNCWNVQDVDIMELSKAVPVVEYFT